MNDMKSLSKSERLKLSLWSRRWEI